MGDAHQSDFFKRFKGKITKMDKSGYIGIVMKSKDPIIKSIIKKQTHNRNNHQALLTGDLKSRSLGKQEFSQKFIKSDVEGSKRIPQITNEAKTPNLIESHKRKNTEIMSKRGKTLFIDEFHLSY